MSFYSSLSPNSQTPKRSRRSKSNRKDWSYSQDGIRLQAFIGSRGYATSTIHDTDELIETAALMFGVPIVRDLATMVIAVADLSLSERRERAQDFIKKAGTCPAERPTG
jgi:hypothetical protein